MAARGSNGTLSKSDAVRDYLSAHATAPVKEIASALSEQGVQASIALINKIKYSDRKSSGRRTLGRRRKLSRGAGVKGASKAQAIRDALAHLGRRTRPRDVIAHLKEGGVIVSAAQVSAIRKNSRKQGRLKRSVAVAKTDAAGGIALDHLIAAKRLADQVGLEAAKSALEFLARLSL